MEYLLVFCTMLNSFVRCRMTTGKIFAKKLCTNLFRLKLFKKKKICQKLLTAHVQSELFLKNQIDQKISFVFPQLSLKYILVLVSRVPICGQTLPSAAATAVDVVFYILLFLQQLLPAVNITGRSIACLLIIEPYVKL